MGDSPINVSVKVRNIGRTSSHKDNRGMLCGGGHASPAFGFAGLLVHCFEPYRMEAMVDNGKVTWGEKVWRILIVDDHPLVRTGLASLIGGEPDLEVCGETDGIDDAMALVRATAPDMLVVDLSLANGNGLELVKRVRAYSEAIRMLVCSMHDEALFAYRALNAGAMGYIGKEEATTHVIDAIRQVLKGRIWLSTRMTERALEGIVQGGLPSHGATVDNLSDRELEVFGLIGRGLGPGAIAEQLHLSIKTIETHRENIKRKLNLRSGSELTRLALHWTFEQS